MEHPTWILVPWSVFALAALLKVWQIFGYVRERRGTRVSRIERFRQDLERNWSRDRLSQS